MENIIAEYVHWRDSYLVKEFVIMWSDFTWEIVRCPFTDYYIGDKSCKQFMELNKVVRAKMTKEEAINHIQKKFKEYEEKWV